MIMAALVAIRDVLIALALAWVGVSVQVQAPSESSCASDRCEASADGR